jgi:quercetin dioxygenase-like cupin family protein
MPRGIRRVVTGHNAAGCSIFIKDAAAPHVYNRGPGSAVVTELWETRAMPADNRGDGELTDHPFRLAPPKHGTVFRIIEYPPDKQRLAALEQQRASADDGSGHGAALASEASGQRGNSIVRAPSASEDARERADDTRPEPGSSARAAFDRGSPRHPGFHKTSSVDYAIVLSGEIYALMDEGEVLLKAGDVLVQRGTNHAWSNRIDAPAYLAFVLVDAEPV